MAQGAQIVPVKFDTGRGKIFIGDGNDYDDLLSPDQSGFLTKTYVIPHLIADGVTDNTSAIESALNEAITKLNSTRSSKTRIKVLLPPGVIKSRSFSVPACVELVGNSTELVSLSEGYFITLLGNAKISNCKINANLGGSTVSIGVHMPSGTSFHAMVVDCNFDGVSGIAILDEGLANIIDNVFAINCLQNTSAITSYTGVIHLSGADGWVTRCETSARGALAMSTNGYACALYCNGSNYQINDHIAETSDHGIYLDLGCNQFKSNGCRAELCWGHGWILAGGGGRITDASGLRNSKQGNALYDNMYVPGTNSAQYTIVNYVSEGASSGAKPNWAINDLNFNNTQYNIYICPRSILTNNGFNSHGGARFVFSQAPASAHSVTGSGNVNFGHSITTLKWNNSSSSSVTKFDSTVSGQRIVMFGDGFTTLVHGSYIKTKTNADLLLVSGQVYEFIKDGDIFYQMY